MDVFEYGNPNASLILLQMIGDHDIEMIDHEFDLIQKAVSDELCLIACKVDDWNRDLSPWKAPAVFKSQNAERGSYIYRRKETALHHWRIFACRVVCSVGSNKD